MDVDVPDILLIVAGLMSFLIVHLYRKDKDSSGYKASIVLGFLVGAALAVVAAVYHTNWGAFDAALIVIAAFALIIRPFRETDLAIIIAVLVMVIAYVYLGTMGGDLEGLSYGTPRIVATVIAGAFTYMVLNFIEKLTLFVGKILNLWPILFLLGLVCLVEGALLISGGSTLFDYYTEWKS